MAKVTSKLQVTLPKVLAEQYGIEPGDEIGWEAAGDVIRVIPGGSRAPKLAPIADRLRWFDAAEKRQRARERGARRKAARNRGWKREDLYRRGRAR